MLVRRVARQAAWGYLVLVLLLAPMLGLMHGLVHGDGENRQMVSAHSADADGHVHEHHSLDDLFSGHGEEADCRLFDQLCHSGLVPALPLLALPMVLSSSVFHLLQGEAIARWAALFEARGPPLTR